MLWCAYCSPGSDGDGDGDDVDIFVQGGARLLCRLVMAAACSNSVFS